MASGPRAANLNTGEQDAHQGRLLLLGMNVSLGDGVPGFRALSELGIQVRLYGIIRWR